MPEKSMAVFDSLQAIQRRKKKVAGNLKERLGITLRRVPSAGH